MKAKIRILIVDDHAMVRMGLGQAIQLERDMCVAGEAANGVQALELYRHLLPDVVTMDYRLPGHDGVAVTTALRKEFPDARVLLLSVYENQECVWRAVQAGVIGYCSKTAETSEVISAIRQVAIGQASFSHGLAEKLNLRKSSESLTIREQQVLQQVVAGLCNKEIMESLNMSQSTVKRHLERIFAKLHVNDRSQAIAVSIQRGLVQLD
jgi:DNA-binding NarL/FixJ family response regulator